MVAGSEVVLLVFVDELLLKNELFSEDFQLLKLLGFGLIDSYKVEFRISSQ
jgi:hypothetical protein